MTVPSTEAEPLMTPGADQVVETPDGPPGTPTSFAEAVEQVGSDSLLGYRLTQQGILSDFGLFALKTRALDDLLAEAVRRSAEGMRTDLCKILEHRPGQDDLFFRAGTGWRAGVVGEVSLGSDTGSPAGYAFRTGTPVISNHLENEERFRTPRVMAEHGVRRAINVLIGTADGPWGILEVDSAHEGEFEAADIAFLQGFANLIGVAIERQEAERKLQEALEHQRLLVSEASHRVKNSLALLSGILRMQSRRAGSEAVSEALDEASGRVIAIARAHDRLWREPGSGVVDLGELVADLCETLKAGLGEVELSCRGEPLAIPSDRAANLALLITELVTNAAKHAYPDGRGAVRVAAARDGDAVLLTVEDDGKGLPPGFDPHAPRSASLGMTLIGTLTRGLGGTMEVRSDPGTTFRVRFPVDQA